MDRFIMCACTENPSKFSNTFVISFYKQKIKVGPIYLLTKLGIYKITLILKDEYKVRHLSHLPVAISFAIQKSCLTLWMEFVV